MKESFGSRGSPDLGSYENPMSEHLSRHSVKSENDCARDGCDDLSQKQDAVIIASNFGSPHVPFFFQHHDACGDLVAGSLTRCEPPLLLTPERKILLTLPEGTAPSLHLPGVLPLGDGSDGSGTILQSVRS
jgi:hypothetical protein